MSLSILDSPAPAIEPDPGGVSVPFDSSLLGEADSLRLVNDFLQTNNCRNLAPILPFMILLPTTGEPFSLKGHEPFAPIFNLDVPPRSVWKCSRQVGKSTSIAGRGALLAAVRHHTRLLYIMPYKDQANRFSQDYLTPMMRNGPLRTFIANAQSAVMKKKLTNDSIIYMGYCHDNPSLLRGIPADILNADEVQDIDYSALQVVEECLSHSSLGIRTYTGTPLTYDNTIEAMHQLSSQAEWCIPCEACNHWNIPSVKHDLLKMIGKTTLVCSDCERPIDGTRGMWIHAYPDRRHEFTGYHLSQPIMPFHFNSEKNWNELHMKMRIYPENRLYNEVLGESYSVGSHPLTMQDILGAQGDWSNELTDELVAKIRQFPQRVVGIDWGGGGADGMSRTTISVCVFTTDGRILNFYGEILKPLRPEQECEYILKIASRVNATWIVHDFSGGAGALREIIMAKAGWPPEQMVPMGYNCVPGAPVCKYMNINENRMRGYYQLDKYKSLSLMCAMIVAKRIKLPRIDLFKPMAEDMLSLVEERHESMGRTYVVMTRNKNKPDDYAHALNFCCHLWWHMHGMYDNLPFAMG